MKKILLSLLSVGMFVAVGCEETTTESATPTTAGASAPVAAEPLPAALLVTVEPAGAVDITAAKASASDGANVVIRGKIGGTKDPLASGRAVMTLIDMTLPTCDTMAGESCPTPWDACCEPKEAITAKSATVQVAGADGRPMKSNLGTLKGVAPGKKVVVAGIARKPAGAETLVIDASQIYVIP